MEKMEDKIELFKQLMEAMRGECKKHHNFIKQQYPPDLSGKLMNFNPLDVSKKIVSVSIARGLPVDSVAFTWSTVYNLRILSIR